MALALLKIFMTLWPHGMQEYKSGFGLIVHMDTLNILETNKNITRLAFSLN